jgi:hypothetical protein
MGLQLKELNKIIAVLEKDRLIRMYAHRMLQLPVHANSVQTPAERTKRGRSTISWQAIFLHRLPALLQCRQMEGG